MTALAGVAHVDPERWLCADDRCPGVVNGVPVFADGMHMTTEYAQKIAPGGIAAVLGAA